VKYSKILKALVTFGAIMIASNSYSGVEVGAAISFSEDPSFDTAPTVSVRLTKDDAYVWGSATKYDQIKKTQHFGEATVVSAGMGYRKSFNSDWRWFAELGVAAAYSDTNDFAAKEAIYFTLTPIFGIPPFREDGNFPALSYSHEFQIGYQTKIGVEYMVNDSSNIHLSYKIHNTRETWAIWNPDWNGGPTDNLHDCGCLWMGSERANFSAVEIGFNYKLKW
jgi:hypothetical protein